VVFACSSGQPHPLLLLALRRRHAPLRR
jgi:hypothetical protein